MLYGALERRVFEDCNSGPRYIRATVKRFRSNALRLYVAVTAAFFLDVSLWSIITY